jgi:hypothetical protein
MTHPEHTEQDNEATLTFQTKTMRSALITIVRPMTARQIATNLNRGEFEFARDAIKDKQGNIIAHVNDIQDTAHDSIYTDFQV